jgi:cell pole-organizing protein PopZ
MAQAAEIPEMGRHREQLVSREVNNAVHAAFNALAQTVLVNNSRTLEDLLREMLQPILTVWINDNLPGIVERLVRFEIEQISPRRRVVSPV